MQTLTPEILCSLINAYVADEPEPEPEPAPQLSPSDAMIHMFREMPESQQTQFVIKLQSELSRRKQ
jgi:hypothetical protein